MCRLDFKLFGKAVTIDSTYKTNKYYLSLGLFCGVNHHKSSVIYAATFVLKEDIDSFVWVFTAFLECMGNLHA